MRSLKFMVNNLVISGRVHAKIKILKVYVLTLLELARTRNAPLSGRCPNCNLIQVDEFLFRVGVCDASRFRIVVSVIAGFVWDNLNY